MSVALSPRPYLPYVSIRPIELASRSPTLLRMYKHARNNFWLPQDVDYNTDAAQWMTALNKPERQLISRIMAFMTASYGNLYDNVLDQISKEVNSVEVRYFFEFQTVSQNIHAESNARALQCIIPDARQRQDILNSSIMLASAAEQMKWAAKWLQGDKLGLAERLVALIFAKTIFYHAGFAIVEWFKERGNLPGLSTLISLIASDAALHAEFAFNVFRDYEHNLNIVFVHNMVDEAVKLETRFVRDALTHLNIPGLNAMVISRFVKHLANETLRTLGFRRRFNASNTMPFAVAACLPINAHTGHLDTESDSSDYSDEDHSDESDSDVVLGDNSSEEEDDNMSLSTDDDEDEDNDRGRLLVRIRVRRVVSASDPPTNDTVPQSDSNGQDTAEHIDPVSVNAQGDNLAQASHADAEMGATT